MLRFLCAFNVHRWIYDGPFYRCCTRCMREYEWDTRMGWWLR